MCGIVGYIGEKKAAPILIKGLQKLEYRGYDSAGIAVLNNSKINVIKDKGRVKNLENDPKLQDAFGNVGIAHTRWATHGIPSKENSHPHMDNSKTFAVVHNGIIENFNELRNFLKSNGYTFYSETDTEVIPNLIHYYYTQDNSDDSVEKFLNSVNLATKDFQGSYAIEVITSLIPDIMIVARKDSPLVIGTSTDENFIASDIPAILEYTNKFYLLDNKEYAVVSKDSIEFYNQNQEKIHKEIEIIDWDATAADKNGFDTYMLKEIFEQPIAIKETIAPRIINPNSECKFDDLSFTKEFLSSINKFYIVACGTAMHAGLTAKNIIEKLCRIPVTVDIASEFRYRNPIIDSNTMCIFVSQSGETADTIAALKLAKSRGATTLTITNVIGSSITRESDYSIYTHAGPEIAVASTKAYTSQVAFLASLGVYFAEVLGSSSEETLHEIKKDLLDIPGKIETILKNTDSIEHIADKIYDQTNMFFIGRGTDYNVALEGSLKLKEISYIHSEAYAAGELKHGPIALIENGITVVGILTDTTLFGKTISNIQEVITRGASTLVITNQDIDTDDYTFVYKIPKTCEFLSPILSVVPLQLLAYNISMKKGLDVDKPRNLAKSVTVE